MVGHDVLGIYFTFVGPYMARRDIFSRIRHTFKRIWNKFSSVWIKVFFAHQNVIWATVRFSQLNLVCLQSTYGSEVYQTCTDTVLSGYQFTPWSSGTSEIHILCPEKFTFGQCRITTRDLTIFSRTRYH